MTPNRSSYGQVTNTKFAESSCPTLRFLLGYCLTFKSLLIKANIEFYLIYKMPLASVSVLFLVPVLPWTQNQSFQAEHLYSHQEFVSSPNCVLSFSKLESVSPKSCFMTSSEISLVKKANYGRTLNFGQNSVRKHRRPTVLFLQSNLL